MVWAVSWSLFFIGCWPSGAFPLPVLGRTEVESEVGHYGCFVDLDGPDVSDDLCFLHL